MWNHFTPGKVIKVQRVTENERNWENVIEETEYNKRTGFSETEHDD